MASEQIDRTVTETGIRLPDGRVLTGANIPDHIVPGEEHVSRTRVVYKDAVTPWVNESERLAARSHYSPTRSPNRAESETEGGPG